MQLDLLSVEEKPVTTQAPISSPPKKSKPSPTLSTPAQAVLAKPGLPMTHHLDISIATDERHNDDKAPRAFKTISEVASFLAVPQHVLRFWESRFSQIKPLKLRGGRRYYRPEDIETLTTIKNLLYKQGYTIKGAKKAFGHITGRIEKPVAETTKTAAPVKVKNMLNDRQQSQLAVIRQELLGMRDILKSHLG